jgi:hypothetical protein
MLEEKTCENVAAFRYTWPGRDESFICHEHVVKLKGVAAAIGMHLQVIPVFTMDEKCRQVLRD